MHPRFDFTFSYWIFGWFILYRLNIIPYNPKLWLILALIYVILFFSFVSIVYRKDWVLIIQELCINTIIKVIPLWILYKTKTTLHDFLFGIFLFIIFGMYMFLQLGSISQIKNYNLSIWNKMIHNEIYTPLLYYLYEK